MTRAVCQWLCLLTILNMTMMSPVFSDVVGTGGIIPDSGTTGRNDPIDPIDPIDRAGTVESSDDRAELEKLMKSMTHLTKIATKTRRNADFVPGMVSVLYGDDLETRGVRTVGEALALVPGINFLTTSNGFGKTIVRGAPKSVASGHVKILLNGTPLTTAFGIDPIPDMPIEQVERIEIIRGPGSPIYGEHAVAGVMNIITRGSDSRLFGGIGRGETYSGGGVFFQEFPEKDLRLSVNLAGLASEDARAGGSPPLMMAFPSDIAEVAPSSFDRDPWGNTKIGREYASGIFSLTRKNFTFRAYRFNNDRDDFFQSNQWGGEGVQELDFSSSLSAKVSLGFRKQVFEPVASDGSESVYQGPEMYVYHYDERTLHGNLELTCNPWENHTLFLGWSVVKTDLKEVWRETDIFIPVSAPMTDTIGTTPVSTELESAFESEVEPVFGERFPGRDRLMHGVTLQDEYQATDRLNLTAGLRYDRYDDLGDQFTPRLSAVFRLNENRASVRRHILKFQYARAFRPATFLEMQARETSLGEGATGPEFETIHTYEAGYIYRHFDAAARITLFYSNLKTGTKEEVAGTEQTGRFRIRGAEFELNHPLIADRLHFDGNISLVSTRDRETGRGIPGAADLISNLGLIYHPVRHLALVLKYRHVDGIEQDGWDTGEEPDHFGTTDITATVFDLGWKGLTLRAGMKNLFKADTHFPTTLYRDDVFGSAPSPLPEADGSERWWWIQCVYQF